MEWTCVKSLCSAYDYETYQEDEFCCANVSHTDPHRPCVICPMEHRAKDSEIDSIVAQAGRGCHDDHSMVEGRLVCKSSACMEVGMCPFKWKVWKCTQSDEWIVLHNGRDHLRQSEPDCGIEHSPAVTDTMKAYILQQDECTIAPMLILSNMKSAREIVPPKRGFPSLQQVQNCFKYPCRHHGTKNTLYAVRQAVDRLKLCVDDTKDTPFVFGAREDENGVPYVGQGTDDDPFILGITTLGLVRACVSFVSNDRTTVFHADATFKLSDVGYPSITCGFTDASRRYQLAAIFIVSCRTTQEYATCLHALVSVIHRVQPDARLQIDYVMGDAEDAQFNAFQQVGVFSRATFLMRFYHVLYNVRKWLQHLAPELRRAVMQGIMHINYADSFDNFVKAKDDVYASWMSIPQLAVFARYFATQWLESRYWRWQVFHTPSGFATTNNPCEGFNATIKVYTGRRRYHMKRLLEITCKIIKDAIVRQRTGIHDIVPPSRTLLVAANAMMTSGNVVAFRTENESVVRVLQLRRTEQPTSEEMEEFQLAVDGPFKRQTISCQAASGSDDVPAPDPDEILGVALTVRAARARASKLYDGIVKWSLKRAHIAGMLTDGWYVDVSRCLCSCRYFMKYRSCAHVIVARKAKKLPVPGHKDKATRLFNRQVRQSRPPQPTTGDTQSSSLSLGFALMRYANHDDPSMTPRDGQQTGYRYHHPRPAYRHHEWLPGDQRVSGSWFDSDPPTQGSESISRQLESCPRNPHLPNSPVATEHWHHDTMRSSPATSIHRSHHESDSQHRQQHTPPIRRQYPPSSQWHPFDSSSPWFQNEYRPDNQRQYPLMTHHDQATSPYPHQTTNPYAHQATGPYPHQATSLYLHQATSGRQHQPTSDHGHQATSHYRIQYINHRQPSHHTSLNPDHQPSRFWHQREHHVTTSNRYSGIEEPYSSPSSLFLQHHITSPSVQPIYHAAPRNPVTDVLAFNSTPTRRGRSPLASRALDIQDYIPT